jgi:hypothetical protein
MKIEKEVYDLFDAGAASILVTCQVKSTFPQDLQSVHQIVISRILDDGKTVHGILDRNQVEAVEKNDHFESVRLRADHDRWF